MENQLKHQVKQIKMPEETKKRILEHCNEKITSEMEKKQMKNITGNENGNKRRNVVSKFKKPAMIAAALTVCLCMTGITAMAAGGKLEGFFKDKVNWNGAITGQTYEQATEEVEVTARLKEDVLVVAVKLLDTAKAPYTEIETLSLGKFQILDGTGKAVSAVEESALEAVVLENGQAELVIPVEGLADGAYTLQISSFVGEKKADQPLEIKGSWEGEFVK